ncbi:MAG: amino acid racemase [Alphaproteobacteria bacterium]|nr:amino acid racemase [Alphaproteobacteria bacterium]
MLHIGILGHSADGSALCYLECVRESARLLGDHVHPEITMSLLPMGPTIPWWESGDLAQINAHLRATAERLAAARCDFFVCPDNTAHIALEAAREPYPLPGLHIAEVVAQRAKVDGRKRIALLGTRYTMEGPVYAAVFARHGLEMRTPGAADRDLLNRIIFDELCLGRFDDPARREFLRVIEALKAEGCDAAALCCTEIPILITPDISPLPALDSTRLLAHAAVAAATGAAPLPTWRGGAF